MATICVHTLTGKRLMLDWADDETVETLKYRLQDKEGVPPGACHLVTLSGLHLRLDSTKAELQMDHMSVIYMASLGPRVEFSRVAPPGAVPFPPCRACCLRAPNPPCCDAAACIRVCDFAEAPGTTSSTAARARILKEVKASKPGTRIACHAAARVLTPVRRHAPSGSRSPQTRNICCLRS